MLECRSCVLRCVRAITGDALLSSRPLVLTPSTVNSASRRSLTTKTNTRPPARRQASNNKKHPIHKDARFEDYDLSSDQPNELLSPTTTSREVAKSEQRALRKEVEWLKDPVKFAEHVHYVLRNEQLDKALDLCRLASRDGNMVVAWNHVINWHMQRRKVNKAIEVYNEMKKRGQFPDSYTYMMILRGYDPKVMAHSPEHTHNFMLKAINIYHSMSSPTSRVRPGTMHTNAVLRLCSLAGDTDAMWGVASKIPDHGPGAADEATYSILLSAIRYGAFGGGGLREAENDHVSVEQIAPRKQQAVDEGRRIWQEVIAKWRRAEIKLDESLVIEMARLLLFSSSLRDWDDIPNLVQQTMRIERQLPELGSPDRKIAHIPHPEEPELPVEDEDGWISAPATNAFKSASQHVSGPAPSAAWVIPGIRTLMVLISACSQMRAPKAAKAYWDKLTTEYGVEPDMGAYKEMMRMQRINRNSRGALELLKRMDQADNVTFRLAMSCCIRNWKDPQIVDTATEVIHSMERHLETPDVRVLNDFLTLAMKTEDSAKIISALKTVDKKADLWYKKVQENSESRDEAVSFFKTMIGAMDFLRNLIPPKRFEKEWNARRSQINSYVSRTVNKLGMSQQKPSKSQRTAMYERPRNEREIDEPAGDIHTKVYSDSRHAYETKMMMAERSSRLRGRRVANKASKSLKIEPVSTVKESERSNRTEEDQETMLK